MKTIHFKEGDIIIQPDTISFSANIINNMTPVQQIMERKLVGGINYEKRTILRRNPHAYAIISFCLSILSLVLSMVFGINGYNKLSDVLSIVCNVLMGFTFIIFIGIVFSVLFDSQWERKLCEYLFGTKVYLIVIQNKSGGQHIEFYVAMDELELAKGLIEYKTEEVYKTHIGKPDVSTNTVDVNQELIELGNLLANGVLSNEEFQDLKRNLLKKL